MTVPDRMLRVDLSAERVRSEPVPAEWLARYVGGKGLGARYLYEMEPGVDPASPANRLAFLVGPLTGYLPGEPRYAAVTKSPLTGAFLDSYGGGSFAARLAGSLGDHLGLVIEGAADDPVALSLAGGEATIEPAGDLRGLDAAETDARFPDAAVACVGPAGESGVRYATIASDGGDHHAGRGGAGAVMGAKGLKAVVARDPAPEVPDALRALRERAEAAFADSDAGRWLAAGDTLETVAFGDETGVLPTRGWQARRFDGADALGVDSASERATGRERPDDSVPGGFRVPTGEGERSDGDADADDSPDAPDATVPRGGTPIALGAGLGIDDFDAVAALGGVCDRLGIDVISAGNAVAWAVRASDAGLIDPADHGVDRGLAFGDEAAARALIEEIAARSTPLADALADGVAAAAERFGGADLVPTVKGMELASYDPRGAATMALAFATGDRGGCHRRARPVETEAVTDPGWGPAERAAVVADEQDRRAALWCLVGDDFLAESFGPAAAAEWLAALGDERDPDDLRLLGERVWTLTRLFNLREGFDRGDDGLPDALTRGTDGAGETDDAPDDGLDPRAFEDLLDRYYAHRGWDREGRPATALLDRLGLADLPDAATPVGSAETVPDFGAADGGGD
ncbi:aldehyde ferredoxin oxidoreductase family protein [Halorubrum lipolyticum]|uniref:Aldehyde ferredoxin oxidoreductase n=1 Tax=Halorubrum lipolyticum DSM 21995 TaxID=1227482 RepID=M0P2A9_9EURY|nr:aldehyde ferredoxin oxidoreductase C-terminal domain-containing protein [Halorubrum lipolyticum]EMA64287.1 aldehyde ferredoxin oxidoreductase [Halorubrum lipolyticum DSM 21995]